jgi:hypothetical protein
LTVMTVGVMIEIMAVAVIMDQTITIAIAMADITDTKRYTM